MGNFNILVFVCYMHVCIYTYSMKDHKDCQGCFKPCIPTNVIGSGRGPLEAETRCGMFS